VKLAVLVSGSGTILEAIVESGLSVTAVLADRQCRGLEVAERAGVEAILVDRTDHGGFGPSFDRDSYTRAVTDVLMGRGIDLIAMAGFGTVLTEPIHESFDARILNTHPALLPAFPGWHGVEDALAAGASVTGCTVHLATLEMDAGPILAQAEVPVLDGDDAQSLHERIKAVERVLYPSTIALALEALSEGRGIETIRDQAMKERLP
jgi:phosphoribosylglycinamide formyltransferase-1